MSAKNTVVHSIAHNVKRSRPLAVVVQTAAGTVIIYTVTWTDLSSILHCNLAIVCKSAWRASLVLVLYFTCSKPLERFRREGRIFSETPRSGINAAT